MMSENMDYLILPFKKMTSPNNKELITVRANIINKKNVVTFSIGTDICDVVGFEKSTRVNLYGHKREKNIFIIKKSNDINDGYVLRLGSSFMTFSIRYIGNLFFRLSQKISIPYEINDDGSVLINIEKIFWRK